MFDNSGGNCGTPEPVYNPNDGSLTVTGTACNDVVNVWFDSDTCYLNINGLFRSYAWPASLEHPRQLFVNTLGGNDTVWYQMGESTYPEIHGGEGDDTTYAYGTGWARGVAFFGEAGTDTFSFEYNGEAVQVNLGTDTISDISDYPMHIWDDPSNERFIGTNFDDFINAYGTDRGRQIFGMGGNDTVIGSLFDDAIYGGTGRDLLYGLDGKDWLEGGADYDRVMGGEGNDYLIGNGDGRSDVLDGEGGEDSIWCDSTDAAFGEHVYVV